MNRVPLGICCCLLILSAGAINGGAQERGGEAKADPLVYRRVFVPEQDLSTQVRGLLPMKRDDFQKRLEAALRNISGRVPSNGRIEGSAYEATFRAGQLVAGTAELDVKCLSDEMNYIGLGEVNIAISSPQWNEDPPRTALLGLTDTGKPVLQAKETSQLKFNWSAAGKPADGGGWLFDLAVPQANRSELRLALPQGWTLTAEPGLVHELVTSAEPDATGRGEISWRLEAGGVSRFRFTVRPPSNERDESLLLVNESASYRFAPGLLDADVSLGLTVHQLPVSQLALRVDPTLNILSIRLGEDRLTWLEGAPDENGVRRLTVELPGPLTLGFHSLQIAGAAEWPSEERRVVPRVHVENGVWQTGTATLTETADVRIHAQSHDGGRQDIALRSDATSTSSMRFEYFSDAARIEVAASRPKARLSVQSGLSLAIDSSQATATLIADLSTTGSINDGNRFDISAGVARRWLIESVETVPADLLEDRSIIARGSDSQQLQVRLRRPLGVDMRARIIIRGRRQRLRDGEAGSSDLLRFVTFNDVQAERRLVSLVATDPEMEPTLVSDSQLERRDPTTLTSYERSLLESAQGDVLIETAVPESVGHLTLRRGEARYSAEIETAIDVSRNAQTNEVRLLIRPEVASVSRVLVRFAPKLKGTVDWSLDSEGSQPVNARMLTGASAVANESLVQVQLPRSHSGDFLLTGRWSEPLDDKSSIPLPSLPEATSQSGTVQVSAGAGVAARVTSDGMYALPLGHETADVNASILARYEYEPGRQSELVISSAKPTERVPQLLVRERAVHSTFSSDGSASHIVEYQLENLGEDRFVVGVPAGATIESVEVDGRTASIVKQVHSGEDVAVSLPSDVRRPKVTLRYGSFSQEGSYWFASEFRAPLPQSEVPCLHESWTVRLAPGLRCWDAVKLPGEQATSLRAFDLFSRSEWSRLWADWGGRLHEEDKTVGSAFDGLGKGWSEYRFDLVDEPYAKMLVYKPVWVGIHGIVLALGIFAITATLPNLTTRPALGIAACIAAALHTFIPIPLVPLVWWALAGVTAAVFWRAFSPLCDTTSTIGMPIRLSRGGLSSLRTSTRLLQLLLLVALVDTGRNVLGGEQETDVEISQVQNRIVFPVDENQQPAGDYVYLSERVFEALHQAIPSQHLDEPTWLLAAATYDVSVTEAEGTHRPSACNIIAEYVIHTSAERAKVQLPLGRGDVHLIASASSLDDSLLAPIWNENRDVLTVEIPNAGRHRLMLHFGMAFTQQDERYLVQVPIPKVPHCKVRYNVDIDRGRGELRTSSGFNAATNDDGELEANLPPSEQLVVTYFPNPESSSPRARVSAGQRIWWSVRPGFMSAEGRFDLTADSGELREIVLRMDPRMRLLPLDSDAGIVRQWTEEGALTKVHLELAPPYPADATLHAKFLLIGAAGGGTFVPPVIEAVADRTERYWEALSTPPGWGLEAFSDRLPTASFVHAWGNTSASPGLAWDRASLGTLPTIKIRPAVGRINANQELEFSLTRDTGRLYYRAQIREESQQLHQCSLSMPRNLRVRNVAAAVGETPIPLRWWQSNEGTLYARFQEAAVASPMYLSIEADWELSAPLKSTSLPLVKLQEVEDSEYQVRVYAESDVALRWERKTGLAPVEESLLGGYVSQRGRLKAHFIADSQSERQLQVRVEPNAPEIAGRLFTVVHEADNVWQAALHCNLEVRKGFLDVLRFELPDHWTGPFEVEPAVDHIVMTVPGQSRKQLVVRLQQPVEDRLSLVIRGPLRPSANDTIRAADVELLEAPLVSRYVALPKSSASALVWETSGIQAVDLDSSTWPATITSQEFEVFRVMAGRFEAVGRRGTDGPRIHRPYVRLADIVASWQENRRYFGTARFDLHPERLTECTIVVPADCRVASVTADGSATEILASGPRTLRVGFGRRRLPLQLEVAFVGRLPLNSSSDESITLQSPYLEGIPVERTQWTVSPISAEKVPTYAEESLLSSAARLELERMASSLAALEKAADAANRPPNSDLQAWASPWRRQYEIASKRVLRSDHTNATETALANELQQLQSRQSKLIQYAEHSLADDKGSEDKNDLVTLSPNSSYILSDGSLPTLKLHYVDDLAGNRAWRRHTVAGWTILGIAGLALLGVRTRASDWLKANSWLAIGLTGVVVTILFPGNPAGWLVTLTAAVSAVFLRWTTATLR